MTGTDQPPTPAAYPCRIERPGHRRGDRIIACDLPTLHDGDHQETDTEITWPREPKPVVEPRVWDLPAEPGTEVTAVRGRAGHLYEREDGGWRYKPTRSALGIRGVRYSWRGLLIDEGPLTDATEAARNTQTGDDQ